MSQKAVISGAYDTAVGRVEGSTAMGLLTEAGRGAMRNAGLKPADIDGVLAAYTIPEHHLMLSSWLAEYLGIQPSFSANVSAGGASGCIMVMNAAALIEAGVCRHVLCITGDNRLTGMSRDAAVATLAKVGHAEFEVPYGINVPASYALVAQRYMHDYGTTSEQMAAIAVTTRRHAGRNPKAQMREPITIDDVLNSRMIASPLHLLDCCVVSDGAAAILVSAADAAPDLAAKPITILGTGQQHTHEHILAAPSLSEFGCHYSSQRAFAAAGLGPQDIDVAEIYDSFTITLVIELESIGFFGRGEAGQAALEGALELDGALPCNTHGGLLSYAHSGAAGGMFHVVEAVRQLRGEADARQVPGAEIGFVHGDGGILSAHCSLVLGRS